jgi:hypothetical protein
MPVDLESASRTIYMIELHEDDEEIDYDARLRNAEVKREKFVKFMVEEVFPAIYTGPSRVGDIDALQLFKDPYSPPESGSYINVYLWMVYGASGGGHANELVTKIEEYGASVTRLKDFYEVAVWKDQPLDS